MIMKSNLGKMLGRMAPMARNNMPQGGLNMAAPPTGYPAPQNPMMAVPHPIVDTPENIQRMPQSRGLADAGSMLARFAEQFRNADNMTNTRPGMFGGMQPRTLTPEEAMAIASMPAAQPTPNVVVEMPRAIPQGMGQVSGVGNAAPAFDPNRALNDYNNRLAGIYQGGGNMDMNMVRAQQANLRNLQLDRNATAEQHDAAYRAALAELRNRYPDAFAG